MANLMIEESHQFEFANNFDFVHGAADAAVFLQLSATATTSTTTTCNFDNSIINSSSNFGSSEECDEMDLETMQNLHNFSPATPKGAENLNEKVNFHENVKKPESPKKNPNPEGKERENVEVQQFQIQQSGYNGWQHVVSVVANGGLETVQNHVDDKDGEKTEGHSNAQENFNLVVNEEHKFQTQTKTNRDVIEDEILQLMKVPDCPDTQNHKDGRNLLSITVPTDVDSLFQLIFTDSEFFNGLHAKRKTFDMKQSNWPEGPDGTEKIRKITFTITLTQAVGPKNSTITETQILHPISRPGQIYVVNVDSVNAKPTPYADSFSIFSHFCMTRISSNETKLEVWNQVKYMQKVNFISKSFIEKNSWSGLEEFYAHLERALKEECSLAKPVKMTSEIPSTSRLRKPATAAGNSRRKSRFSRTKGPAPSPPSRKASLSGVAVDKEKKSKFGLGGLTFPVTLTMTHIKIALFVVILLLITLNILLFLKLQSLEAQRSGWASRFQVDGMPISSEDQDDAKAAYEWVTEKLEKQEMNYREELIKWRKAIELAASNFHKWGEEQQNLKMHLMTYAKDQVSGKLNRWTDWELS